MTAFKIIMPNNPDLYALTLAKIIDLFYDPEETGDFYCFKNKGNMLISDDYADYVSWKEQGISIPKFLDIVQINGDLGNVPFPSWINSMILMYRNKNGLWNKGVFSCITDKGFMFNSTDYSLIAPLDDNYLFTDILHSEEIDYNNINEYDISKVPGIGFEREIDT
jgi:hypothetical protein